MIKLIQGDMLNELTKLESNSIDLVLADLPYGQTECQWDNKIDLVSLWSELKRIGKPNTCFAFFCTTRFGYELIKSNEKWFKYDLVWNKVVACGFLQARKRPMRNHEMIYIFYDKQPVYNLEDNHTYTAKITDKPRDNKGCYGIRKSFVQNSGTYEPKLPVSIIEIQRNMYRKAQKHPTEKPIELFEWLIKYYTNKDGKVLDICFGSGNSALAANNLNREYIGFELDEKYFTNANKFFEK